MSLLSGLTEEVQPGERLARFLRSSSHVAKHHGRIKAAAFLPAPDDDTSVFRASGLDDTEVRELGTQHVQSSTRHGTALVAAEKVYAEDLEIVPEEEEGPPRHANIRGWPVSNDPEIQKNQRRLKAEAIASEANWLPPEVSN